MNKHLLIVGAGGYIGSEVVKQALKSGRRVTALDTFFFGKDKLSQIQEHPNLAIVQADIRTVSGKILRGIHEVINLAGISNDPACDLNPELTESINRKGCIRITKLAKEEGVERFINMSSCSVYGQALADICDEKTPPNPVSLYAKIKLAVEEVVSELASNDFCTTSLRNSTTFGPSKRMRFDLVVNIMTLNAIRKKLIKVSGDGRQRRPLIHVRDVAESSIRILDGDPTVINGEIFNLVGTNAEIIEVAHRVRDALQNGLRIEFFEQDYDIRTYQVDDSKLRNTLGIKPKRTIEDGVREIAEGLKRGEIRNNPDCYTVQFYKNNPDIR